MTDVLDPPVHVLRDGAEVTVVSKTDSNATHASEP